MTVRVKRACEGLSNLGSDFVASLLFGQKSGLSLIHHYKLEHLCGTANERPLYYQKLSYRCKMSRGSRDTTQGILKSSMRDNYSEHGVEEVS